MIIKGLNGITVISDWLSIYHQPAKSYKYIYRWYQSKFEKVQWILESVFKLFINRSQFKAQIKINLIEGCTLHSYYCLLSW